MDYGIISLHHKLFKYSYLRSAVTLSTFSLITATCPDENIKVYGLKCQFGTEEILINDITTERERAELIYNTFNAEKPDKVHIYDILENYLIDFGGF